MSRVPAGRVSIRISPCSFLFAAAVIASCQSSRVSEVQSMPPGTVEGPISCRAIAAAAGDDMYSLRFEIRNAGTEPVELSTYEPFTAFSLTGRAGNDPLTVHQPALDIPVKPATVRVPPKSAVTVTTPIRLRIADAAAPGTDGFIWTIPHDRKSVSLEVKLNLPKPFGAVCPVVFQ